MRHQQRIHIAWYVFSDFLTTSLAWAFFFILRKILLNEPFRNLSEIFTDSKFLMGIVIIPIGWILLSTLSGTYVNLYRKSRLNEIILSFFTSLIGSMILFFLFLLDDDVQDYTYFYEAFFLLWGLSFILMFCGRILLLTVAKKQIINGDVWFDILMIGNGSTAKNVFEELARNNQWLGYRFSGFLSVHNENELK